MALEKLNGQIISCILNNVPTGISGQMHKKHKCSAFTCVVKHRLLSGLTLAQLANYHTLKQIITDRYEPKERDVAYRCQFRYCKREKGESATDYGYHLNRLAQKAYPNLTLNQLEIHVIDQFINGLANFELQKHVQFGHPKTLHEAISLATKFEALEGSVDRIRKPVNTVEKVAPIITPSSTKQQDTSITLEQIDKLIEKKLNSLSANNRPRSRSPSAKRYDTKNKIPANQEIQPKSQIRETYTPKSEKYCTYCKRQFHIIDECRTRQYHERQKTIKQNRSKNNDAAYIITSQEQTYQTPQIVITPCNNKSESIISDDINTGCSNANQQQHTLDEFETEISTAKTSNEQLLNPIITNSIYDKENDIKAEIANASCLYLQAEIFKSDYKLLIDTGSPYSILSFKCFEKLQKTHEATLIKDPINLTAADGSKLEIQGKTMIEFRCQGQTYQQHFIVARIQGIVGILGMDFLTTYDGNIKIKQHLLKTSKGKLKLHEQNANTCARILVQDNILIEPNQKD